MQTTTMDPDRKRCGAPTKANTPCRNWAAAGEEHCSDHGGAAPRADARRARKVMEATLPHPRLVAGGVR